MTRKEKRQFIRQLCRAIRADILQAVPKMPDEWDGHELRAYIAERFEQSVMTVNRKGPYGRDWIARTRAYRNTIRVRGL